MALEKSFRRLPLRDLMTDGEKRSRDLAEHFATTWLLRVTELRDLSRPVRKRSSYPTLLALKHALERVLQCDQETAVLLDYLSQELEEIREHARREKYSRK
jgi:hypothetical protein